MFDEHKPVFPQAKHTVQDFLTDEEGNISRTKMITIGSMVILMSLMMSLEAFADHSSHSSHSSHQSHASSSTYVPPSTHSSHSSGTYTPPSSGGDNSGYGWDFSTPQPSHSSHISAHSSVSVPNIQSPKHIELNSDLASGALTLPPVESSAGSLQTNPSAISLPEINPQDTPKV